MKTVAYGSYAHFNVCFRTVTMGRGGVKMVKSCGDQKDIYNFTSDHPLKLEESALHESWWEAGFQFP